MRGTMSARSEHQTVPLSVLLKRELQNEKIEKPEIVHGQASQSKKGEDFTLLKTECQRVMGDGVSTYSVFGVCIVSSSYDQIVLFRINHHIAFFDSDLMDYNGMHQKSICVVSYFTFDADMT